MAILGRDRRAAAMGMLWMPLQPAPDNAALSVDDRKIVAGIYPIRVIIVTSGGSVGTRGRNYGDAEYDHVMPTLLGQYIPDMDMPW